MGFGAPITALINGLIVLPPDGSAGESRVTTMRFSRDRILSLDILAARGDRIVDVAGCVVYPGLVNAHDHLELNHYPRTKFRPVYANAAEWSADFTPRLEIEPFRSLRALPLANQCWIGGLKNLYSGVTTVAHHNPLHKPLRRADFPVRVVQRYGWAHSFALEHGDLQVGYRRTLLDAPWMIHLAEGTDARAADELTRLSALDLLHTNTLLIHGVGLRTADRAQMITAGAGLVWCPSTNFYLLGATAQVRELSAVGLLAIGSDSRLTADGDLLDELRAAYLTGQLTPAALFRAVTTDAARLLHIPRAGSLLPGSLPDFFVTRAPLSPDPYRALIDLHAADIESIWIRGRVVDSVRPG